ncbi:MAG: transposase [Nanoarchaeota archaeon]
MTTKRRLFNKIRAHLRAAGVPRYIQRQGVMWYTTAELVLGLAVREAYRLSYRRAAAFLDEYYGLRLHWTTLQKAAARLPTWFWHHVLRATAPGFSPVAAVDGTGYARACPSEHYLHRKRLRDDFPKDEYGQRNIVEAVFHSLKARFGGHVRGRSARTVRAEIMMRLILHNIRVLKIVTFYLPA